MSGTLQRRTLKLDGVEQPSHKIVHHIHRDIFGGAGRVMSHGRCRCQDIFRRIEGRPQRLADGAACCILDRAGDVARRVVCRDIAAPQWVLHQTTLPTQVVIADDGSGEPTAEVVRAFVPRLEAVGVPLVHAWHPDEGFRLAAVRNLALALATGDYVLMVDGDCVLHPGFVRSHVAFARPGAFVQGSRVLVGQARSARRNLRQRRVGVAGDRAAPRGGDADGGRGGGGRD